MFLKKELIFQNKKDGSDEVINMKLQPILLKSEKKDTQETSADKESSDKYTVQVIDIPAYKKFDEICSNFEAIGAIEKITTHDHDYIKMHLLRSRNWRIFNSLIITGTILLEKTLLESYLKYFFKMITNLGNYFIYDCLEFIITLVVII